MLEQYAELRARRPELSPEVWLRVNPGFGHGHSRKTNTGGEHSKHGVWHEELPACLARATRAGLRVTGVHVHIGSGADMEHLALVAKAGAGAQWNTALRELVEPILGHEAAVAAGLIEPCLIAFPDGYGDSFWADSTNSAKPAETNVRLEIIPCLDANYRTVASRSRRAMQGFSMGGFGAAKFAATFREFPPAQKAASFTVDDALKAMETAGTGG